MTAVKASLIGLALGPVAAVVAGAVLGGVTRASICCSRAPDFATGAVVGAIGYGMLLTPVACMLCSVVGAIVGWGFGRSDDRW